MNVDNIKDWFTFSVAVIACVAGVIFWVQSSNDPRFEKIEKEISTLTQDIKNIRVTFLSFDSFIRQRHSK